MVATVKVGPPGKRKGAIAVSMPALHARLLLGLAKRMWAMVKP